MTTRFDLPAPDPDTVPWWEACNERRLLLRWCTACERVHFYPRPFCPSCWSTEVTWVEASGRARLYTWSIVHRNDLPPWPEKVPYVVAVVELVEGPRMSTRLVDVEDAALSVGLELEVDFEAHTEDQLVPVFRPASKPARQ